MQFTPVDYFQWNTPSPHTYTLANRKRMFLKRLNIICLTYELENILSVQVEVFLYLILALSKN